MHGRRVLIRRIPTTTSVRRQCLRVRLFTTEVPAEPSPSTSSPTPPPTPKRARTWSRPIANGVIKAYDEALSLIQHDSNIKIREMDQIRKELRTSTLGETKKADLQKRLSKLEIESQINLPEVRWGIEEGIVDMSNPVYRHLVEKAWRKEGRLDLLMERIHQMHVIPDVVPPMHPTVDLRVFLDRKDPSASSSTYEIEPGEFIEPRRTTSMPKFKATVFHKERRLYTLLMIDPDVPDVANRSFRTYLHLLQPNIRLSATSPSTLRLPSSPCVPWIPPHPQNGTPYHRYVSLLLPQPDSTAPITLTLSPNDRLGFDVRAFIAQHRLGGKADGEEGGTEMMKMVPKTYAERAGKGLAGGMHMWRAIWDEDVTSIYQTILKIPEPKYGTPPKPDPYRGRKVNKYLS